VNPILEDGEPGLEIDTNQIKYGDGNSSWQTLPYSGYTLDQTYITVANGGGGMVTARGNSGVLMADNEAGVATLIFEGNSQYWWSQYGDLGNDWNDDWGSGVAYQSNGLVVVGGSFAEGYDTDPNSMVLKYSAQGELLWQRELYDNYTGGTVADNIWIGRDNSIILTMTNDNNGEGYITVLDDTGALQANMLIWDGPDPNITSIDGIQGAASSDDLIYITGEHNNIAWIQQWNTDNLSGGSPNWDKEIYIDGYNGVFYDCVAHDAGVFACGEGYDEIADGLDYPQYQGYIASFEGNGDLNWHAVYKQLEQGSGWMGWLGVRRLSGGDLIVIGTWWNQGNDVRSRITVARLDAQSGEAIWCKRTKYNNHNTMGVSVVIGSDDSIYIMGVTSDRPQRNNYRGLYFAKMNSDGAVIWQNTLGGDNSSLITYYYNGHRELCLSTDGMYLATTGYGYIAPGNNSSNYYHMVTAQLPTDGSQATAYVMRNNLSYEASVLEWEDVVLHISQLSTSAYIQNNTAGWSYYSDYSEIGDVSSTTNQVARNQTLTRFGGTWQFQNGDITLPVDGDILTNNGKNSAIHDLSVVDNHNLENDYTLQLSDRGRLVYQRGYYTVYVPERYSVDFPVGTTITIVNAGGNGTLRIQVVNNNSGQNPIYAAGTDSESYVWTLPSNSIATLIKVWNDPDNSNVCKWLISGIGLANGA
jgi:hypothetical protein